MKHHCLQKLVSRKSTKKVAQSPENEMNSSPALLSDKLSEISVDICRCCNQPCDGDGVKGQALQCDLYDGWFHALCENMGNKQYKSFLLWLSL